MTSNPNVSEESVWIPDTRTFGARLALVRWQMGWNIAEAERECGVTQNLWANWEAGSMPRRYVEVVGQIAWASKVDRMWLMTGDADASSAAPVKAVKLPGLDSNQEPIGSTLAPVTSLSDRERKLKTPTTAPAVVSKFPAVGNG